MSPKVNRVITVLFLIVVVIIVMIFLNGTAIHNVSEQNIENDFLQKLYQKGFEDGEIVDKYVYNNSETLFFKNQKEQNAVAVYVKSLYSSQWKEYSLLQFEQGENVSIFVDDHIFQYRINYQQNEISIGEQKPLLAIRLFSIGVIVTAAAIGRMVGIYMERKKMDIFGKNDIKNKIINGLCIVGIVCIFLLYINQGGFYSIKGEELESTFLWDIEQRHEFKNGSVVGKQNYKNSITLFYEGECGNIAVTTYIKSFYSDKWKEVWSMTWNQDMGDYDFSIVTNDHIYAYATTYHVKQGKFYVEFEDVRKPEVLLSRVCDFAIIMVGCLIGNKLAHLLKIDKKSRMNKK